MFRIVVIDDIQAGGQEKALDLNSAAALLEMTLTSFLLNSSSSIDPGLDSLFSSPTVQTPTSDSVPGPSKESSKKRKIQAERDVATPAKRVRPSPPKQEQRSSTKSAMIVQNDLKSDKVTRPKKKDGKGKERTKVPVADSERKDDNSDLENAYESGKFVQKTIGDHEESDGLDDDDVEVPTTLIHESLQKNAKKASRTPKQKYVPQDETPNLRDQRTVFVGNLPIELASKKPLSKQLQRHILSFVTTAKIESVRFRSIPFHTPTSKLPTSDDEGDGTKNKLKPQTPKKDVRPHDRERASVWRSKTIDKDEAGAKQDEKKYITPGQKKKIAFINQEFHSTADTVNAYIVFAHPVNTESRHSNLPPLPPTLDPYEAARLAVEKCDGTLFMERMIRVDRVGKSKEAGSTITTDSDEKSTIIVTDPKLSVFVGNLDFATKEEDLRVFFEGLVVTEKGLPPAHDETDGDEGVQRKPLTWVTRVRIVRDKDTQLGKGFAYVQFTDRACVDELLALEETKLKFAKRKLRVQRCKTLPGSKLPVTAASNSKKQVTTAVVIPKGDPSLGEKLAGLSKDERKQRKMTDADRVARRLAKKKARMALAPGVGTVKSQVKDRERVRKTTGQRKASSGGGKRDGRSRGRIRSAISTTKKNTKK